MCSSDLDIMVPGYRNDNVTNIRLRPVRNILIGIVAKIILTYVLTSIPSINVVGAAIGTVCAYGIAMLLNFNDVKRFARVRYDVKGSLVRPVIAALIIIVLKICHVKIIEI